MSARIGLSTSSVFPESTAAAFDWARRLGYDGVEVMVGVDAISQDVDVLSELVQHYQVPVLSVHAPCLLITQRVWGTDSWGKLVRAREAAERLGAATVVVHPPFRWQRDYARDFVTGLDRMANETDIRFAVENMYPWKAGPGQVAAYAPNWDIRLDDYRDTTIDLSHTSISGTDPIEMARDLGDRLSHIHLTDGTESNRDEHLVPGRGTQPVAEFLEHCATVGFDKDIIVEVSTRTSVDRAARERDLAESLAFARLHFAPRTGEPEVR
jgi:sugar phosphate isomerase/epimerase